MLYPSAYFTKSKKGTRKIARHTVAWNSAAISEGLPSNGGCQFGSHADSLYSSGIWSARGTLLRGEVLISVMELEERVKIRTLLQAVHHGGCVHTRNERADHYHFICVLSGRYLSLRFCFPPPSFKARRSRSHGVKDWCKQWTQRTRTN